MSEVSVTILSIMYYFVYSITQFQVAQIFLARVENLFEEIKFS